MTDFLEGFNLWKENDMEASELKFYRYFVEASLKKLKVMQKDFELMLKMINKQIEKEESNDSNT